MKGLGYGAGYKYTPDAGYSRGAPEGMSYFPDNLRGTTLFDQHDIELGHKLHGT
jgi:replication-associated recombination protein RarA